MTRKRTLGMRDIPTIQGLRHRATPGTREQTVAEVARLEHEKARLQRELDIWLGNQERTERRIQQVQERLTMLQALLEPDKGRQAQQSVDADGDDTAEGGSPGWKAVPLEY
jgi:predicted  nucleic acid-binding Zn-ribbon protein